MPRQPALALLLALWPAASDAQPPARRPPGTPAAPSVDARTGASPKAAPVAAHGSPEGPPTLSVGRPGRGAELRLKLRAGYWHAPLPRVDPLPAGTADSIDNHLHFAGGELGLGARARWAALSAAADLRVEGAYRREASPFVAADTEAGALEDLDRGPGARVRLREAYGQAGGEPGFVRAGYQVVSFGRAEFVRPADHFNRLDLRVRSSNPQDLRLGVPAVRAERRLGRLTFTAVWAPVHRPTILVPAPAVEPLPFSPAQDRPFSWERPELLGRAAWALPARAEVAASAFWGYPQAPELLRVATPSDDRLALRPHHPRIFTGAVETFWPTRVVDLAYEASLRRVPDPPAGDAPTHLLDQYLHVLKVSRGERRDRLSGAFQIIQRFTPGADELQARGGAVGRPTLYARVFLYEEQPMQTSLSARVSGRLPRRDLEADLSGVVNFTPHADTPAGDAVWPFAQVPPTDVWLLPRLGWTPTPPLTLVLGASYLAGRDSIDDPTPFGRNQARSTVYLELTARL